VYASEAEVRQVLGLCASYPVMAQRRVVIIREFEKLEENRLFTSYAEHPNGTAVVLLVCTSKPNLSTHPYRALKQHGAAVEFKALRDREMPGWVSSRLKSLGFSIEPRALQIVTDFVGTDLRVAAGELEKIITYAGESDTITLDHVIAASGQTREFSVFELQKAVGEQRLTDAVRIGERLLQMASNPAGEALMIVAILTAYFSKLWRMLPYQAQHMPEREMAGKLGVNPYFIGDYLTGLRLHGPVGIERAFRVLLAADYELKGGAVRDPRTVLLLMLTHIVSSTR
ncbi:MAG: DNA polymerase III subunit delta, partial [Rhodothermales bacterium]